MTALHSSSNVVSLSGRLGPLSDAELRAAIRAENERHAAALDALLGGFAGERSGALQGAPVAAQGEVLSLAKAAYAIGWAEQRLRTAIVRQSKLPPQHRFAWQPGGVRNAPWHVDMDRLRRYVRDLPPDGF